jgi:S-adenosylmethionine synthetase
MANINYTISMAYNRLSANALNEIYTNLPTVVEQTITVTGNYGNASDDPTIATAKGWTVTG